MNWEGRDYEEQRLLIDTETTMRWTIYRQWQDQPIERLESFDQYQEAVQAIRAIAHQWRLAKTHQRAPHDKERGQQSTPPAYRLNVRSWRGTMSTTGRLWLEETQDATPDSCQDDGNTHRISECD